MERTDAELVSRIRDGNTEEFGELIRRHQSQVFAVLFRYERDSHRLEDLAQETFLKAWRSLDQYDGRAPFQHWLTRIAAHAAIDHLRRNKRRQQELGFDDLGEGALEWLRTEDGHGELEARQAGELLRLAMRELSPAEQVVITMRELEGRSVKEIAAATGSSGVAVRVRALRARTKLRRALRQLMAGENDPAAKS
jgi:RNA polymerase sigma-70 factor (ECF subfamily)